jgi:hypothetical protein
MNIRNRMRKIEKNYQINECSLSQVRRLREKLCKNFIGDDAPNFESFYEACLEIIKKDGLRVSSDEIKKEHAACLDVYRYFDES